MKSCFSIPDKVVLAGVVLLGGLLAGGCRPVGGEASRTRPALRTASPAAFQTPTPGLTPAAPQTGLPASPEPPAGTIPVEPIPAASAGAPIIRAVSLNAAEVERYGKLEITFQVATVAENLQLPFDPSPPPGLQPAMGVSVQAQFTPDDWRTVYSQPAFYFQDFEYEVRSGREWIYPTDRYAWKVRFSPTTAGDWQLRLAAEDAGGRTETEPLTFRVIPSSRRGFVRVSRADPRYFEFEDASYFPALGYNLNYDQVSWTNPVLDNQPDFEIMQKNGIQLIRMWLSQWGIYGPSWNPWNSIDPAQHGRLIPFSGLSFDDPYPGSEVSMRLRSGTNPCMFLGFMKPPPAVKPETRYRIRVRYRTEGLSGPRLEGSPYGLTVKIGGWLADESGNCSDPGIGERVAPLQSENSSGWRVLEGELATQNSNFLPNFYLVLENVSEGSAFIDYVWIEEDLGGGQLGPNIVSKPWMAHHLYFEQRGSFAFDKVVELAEQYDIYLRPVLLEKEDWIFNRIDDLGQPILYNPGCDTQDGAADPAVCPGNRWFYGSGRKMTKVRWLQQAWWRYVQARWGYSPNIHSWELLNEGDPDNELHYVLADEFGRYMHAFGPNSHLVSTSFWHSFPREAFWANPSYPSLDFADIHKYIEETSPLFADTAEMTAGLSLQIGARSPDGPGKPVVRGETGLAAGPGSRAAALLEADTDGLWLHNFLWAQLNPGGLIESYWWVEPHILQRRGQAPGVDHRIQFGIFHNFIKDLPLNNGQYEDAAAAVSSSQLRVFGQKDTVDGSAHLWIQNIEHTWMNAVNRTLPGPVSGTVSLGGFVPGASYRVDWWDPYQPHSSRAVIRSENLAADASGRITLVIDGLLADTAVKLKILGGD